MPSLPSVVPSAPRADDGLWRRWKRAAFGTPRAPVRTRPTRRGDSSLARELGWSSNGLSIRRSRVRVPHASRGAGAVQAGPPAAFSPGWCTGQHRGVRSPNSQFESGPGYRLATRRSSADPEHCPPKAGVVRSNRTGETAGPSDPRRVHSMSGAQHVRCTARRVHSICRHRIAVVRRILTPEAGGQHPVAVRRMRGSSVVERPVVARRRRGFDALPRSTLGAEVLKDARVASTHEEPGRYRPALPSPGRRPGRAGPEPDGTAPP